VYASRGHGCLCQANAGTKATVEARMLQRTSTSPVLAGLPQLLGQ
jgi:hypothetical protein